MKNKKWFMKKRAAAILLSSGLMLALSACGGQTGTGNSASAGAQGTGDSTSADTRGTGTSQSADSQGTTAAGEGADTQGSLLDGNILVAYLSVPETDGTDTVAGASRVVVDGEVLGNNQYVAQLIAQETGGDLFRIETVQEYPGTHEELLDFAYSEMVDNARPELATQIENPDSYDVIFLGYPNWNSDLPMPLYTFLKTYDFAGKTIIPFTTHGGSGFSRTIGTIGELQPDATVVENGLSISRNDVPDAQAEVTSWLSGL